MLEDLFDRDIAGLPVVTILLVTAMLVVSVPTLLQPELYRVFGGVGSLDYPWQVFSSAFEHGWPGFPLLPHLLIDLLLILVVGVAAEAMLGAARFFALTVAAIGCYWLARALTGIEANGSSVFIWSYAPIVLLGVLHTARHGGSGGSVYERLRSMLIIMWIVVPLVLGGLALARGANPMMAIPVANVFHISATVAGFGGALAWSDWVTRRLSGGDFERSRADRAAVVLCAAIPAFFAVVLVLAVVGLLGR
jgi:hypothetical protein